MRLLGPSVFLTVGNKKYNQADKQYCQKQQCNDALGSDTFFHLVIHVCLAVVPSVQPKKTRCHYDKHDVHVEGIVKGELRDVLDLAATFRCNAKRPKQEIQDQRCCHDAHIHHSSDVQGHPPTVVLGIDHHQWRHHQIRINEAHDASKHHAIGVQHRGNGNVAHRSDESHCRNKRCYCCILERDQPIRQIAARIHKENTFPHTGWNQHRHESGDGEANEYFFPYHFPVRDEAV